MRFSAIISSVKPFKDDAYTQLQKTAIASWLPLADHVFLFNHRDEVGDLVPVHLIHPTQSPPTIKQMLNDTSREGVIAIVNSDIVLTPDVLHCLDVVHDKNMGRTWAATSFRYEGEPPDVKGQGLDIFVLGPGVVPHILRDIPDFMTIGRIMWDSWINGWLRRNLKSSHYFDMTPWKCVFHPEHERPNGVGGDHSIYNAGQIREILKLEAAGFQGIPQTKYQCQ